MRGKLVVGLVEAEEVGGMLEAGHIKDPLDAPLAPLQPHRQRQFAYS